LAAEETKNRMGRQVFTLVRGLLAIMLMVGVVSSANVRDVAHDPMELSQILADHHAEIEHHGHAHEDIIDVLHAYHGHAHQLSDHDHNVMSLPPRSDMGMVMPTSLKGPMANFAMLTRRDDGLERPPRV
jgi:ABC-type nickel/cobalt efflux system permease component RcnA